MEIQHIVLLKCRVDVSEREMNEIFEGLQSIKRFIPGITSFSGGRNNSLEGNAKGYTHGFILTFVDEASRKTYLPHPEHKKIQKKIGKVLADVSDNVLVFDYSF